MSVLHERDRFMIRINQLKLPVEQATGKEIEELTRKAAGMLHIDKSLILQLHIIRRSIDARKKPQIFYTYTVDVAVEQEQFLLKKAQKGKDKDKITQATKVLYRFPECADEKAPKPKVIIVGSGPAGLFCGYYLAKAGYAPIILERGKAVEERTRDVEQFWNTGKLLAHSNVQFGEGGAGTFSDGKLNTLVKDKAGRNHEVLRIFVTHGAPKEIQYDAKPHIGTDVLCAIVKSMRMEIEKQGGQVLFEHQMTDLCVKNGHISGVVVNEKEVFDCDRLVLAIGHSARDTFQMLYEKQVTMEQKDFAVGFRVEHPQSMINISQYGEQMEMLGAAPYKVTAPSSMKRGVYSFCMCPGGYVVNASSQEGRLAVNGMSYSGRDGKNANSAIIVQVGSKDFGSDHPLAGTWFQQQLEERAYELGKGSIPVQRYGDFCRCLREKDPEGEKSKNHTPETAASFIIEPGFEPACKGTYKWADLTEILPLECNKAFVEGMDAFGRQISGFDRPDAILSGVESRTSSPVRIVRDECMQSNIAGIYPCGEGAGYAGGITSAAMDGLRVAEAIVIDGNSKIQ